MIGLQAGVQDRRRGVNGLQAGVQDRRRGVNGLQDSGEYNEEMVILVIRIYITGGGGWRAVQAEFLHMFCSPPRSPGDLLKGQRPEISLFVHIFI